MNPEDLRLAGEALGNYLSQFGINTAKTAGRVGAEKLGIAIGNRIGRVIAPQNANPPGSSIDKAQAYRMQTMMLAHQQQLQQLAIEEQMQQQKYLQQLGTIQARHQYDRPVPSASMGQAGFGQAMPITSPVDLSQIYTNAFNAPRAQNRIF
jgi:hypothetical protein